MSNKNNATKRFSSRVENYVKYRPSYPTAVLECLREECGLEETAVIADIGSGTGLLSKLFLDNGNQVYGVEPNQAMREAGETFLSQYSTFHSINGTAKETGLSENSVDFITAGQAFHWFDFKNARIEFSRILKQGGTVAGVWNSQDYDGDPFMNAYREKVQKFSPDFQHVKQTNSQSQLEAFFNHQFEHRSFLNEQTFDFESLKGRHLSSSYSPLPDSPNYEPSMVALRELFEAFAVNGRVQFNYITNLFWGQ